MRPIAPRLITDVFPHDGKCAVHLDHQGQEYRLCWSGDWRKLPDLSTFPEVVDATVSRIPHGPAMTRLWSTSRVITHGFDAHIRELVDTCEDDFPICKVAIDARQQSSISEEFRMLRLLATSAPNFPIPRTHQSPLREGTDFIGFRMERLHDIPLGGHLEHFGEVEEAILKLRDHGIVHFDLSPNNIMLNALGRITIIDFGRAGQVGQVVPAHKARPGVSEETLYSHSVDAGDLKKLHGKLRAALPLSCPWLTLSSQ